MKRYCLALDLVDDQERIATYERYHEKVWPEIIESIKETGIEQLEIYRFSNRLFMIMEATDTFTFEAKRAADKANKKVQEWEELMWNYQLAIPGTSAGEKWVLMKKIFSLNAD